MSNNSLELIITARDSISLNIFFICMNTGLRRNFTKIFVRKTGQTIETNCHEETKYEFINKKKKIGRSKNQTSSNIYHKNSTSQFFYGLSKKLPFDFCHFNRFIWINYLINLFFCIVIIYF